MIYLDNNATTRVLPEVVETLLPFYTELWGNPSSLHTFGAQVARHIDKAREQVAALIGAARPGEIVFTSGGTESNNLALRGILAAAPDKRRVVTTAVEHPSVLALCKQLEKEGMAVTYLGAGKNGETDLSTLAEAIRPDTALVSIMWANNETGVLFPIEAMARICEAKNVPLHVDATQAVGKIPIDLKRLPGVKILSLSGHKFHAPKGIGALYLRRGTRLAPQILGGSQEKNLRGGTLNTAGIAGLGKATELARLRLESNHWEGIRKLRDDFEQTVTRKFPFARINGGLSPRLPNTSSISFEGCEAEAVSLLLSEENIAASTGSACSAGSLEPSHVLKAMGFNAKQARGTVRFSLSCETTKEELEETMRALEKIVGRLKKC